MINLQILFFPVAQRLIVASSSPFLSRLVSPSTMFLIEDSSNTQDYNYNNHNLGGNDNNNPFSLSHSLFVDEVMRSFINPSSRQRQALEMMEKFERKSRRQGRRKRRVLLT